MNGPWKKRIGTWIASRGQHNEAVASMRRRSLILIPVVSGLILLVLWSTVLGLIRNERKATWEAAVSTSGVLATSLAQHIAKTIHDADLVVRVVKYEYERSPSTFDLVAYQRNGLLTADTALQITIVDANGDIAQTTTPHARPANLSDRLHFQIHQRDPGAGLYISQPVIGRISQHWTLQFTRRLNHPDGSFAGVVVVSEDPGYLTDGFSLDTALGGRGMVAVLSDNGYLLSRRAGDEPASPTGPPVSAYVDEARAGQGAFADPVDHVQRIVAYRHLRQYPVAVIAGLAEEDVFAAWRRTKEIYLAMGSVVTVLLLIGTAAAMFFMRQLMRSRAQMQRLSETDSLTGLPNRHWLTLTLGRRVLEDASIDHLAVVYIDLDNFKKINDSLGHKAGDQLLQKVASRLATAAGKQHVVARIGGDEFVILVEGSDAAARAHAVACEVIDAFGLAFALRGNSWIVRVSIGVAVHTGRGDTEFDLLTHADLAMYAAKADGKAAGISCQHLYTPDLSERAKRETERYQELQYALNRGELQVVYQPVVRLATGEIASVEALVRWHHPQRGVIPATDFLPFAEATGLIVPIGDLVLEQVCRQLCEWQEAQARTVTVSVNISSVQLASEYLVGSVRHLLTDYMIEPGSLQLEVIEAALFDDPVLMGRRLESLRELGVKIVLDDFGEGRSSLAHLWRFTVDGVKVHQSLTRGIPDDKVAMATLRSLAELTDALDLTLGVKGVESPRQADWLARFERVQVQGFYFSKPLAAASLAAGMTP
ncbi:putative bifunctional diguanylate cyclase/phosphodiesterase [Paraburkholderia sp. HD33-4]|uniref:putative bifunctional diguanylate cyclase/phosphodiesterase n=1 Tax=Paraburkholderia sp. HD33-4 TaxID=2883242 RepID=UPI001F281499|nr:EAL domain-containing protein [Paraburkholderia sp. HD33-4]